MERGHLLNRSPYHKLSSPAMVQRTAQLSDFRSIYIKSTSRYGQATVMVVYLKITLPGWRCLPHSVRWVLWLFLQQTSASPQPLPAPTVSGGNIRIRRTNPDKNTDTHCRNCISLHGTATGAFTSVSDLFHGIIMPFSASLLPVVLGSFHQHFRLMISYLHGQPLPFYTWGHSSVKNWIGRERDNCIMITPHSRIIRTIMISETPLPCTLWLWSHCVRMASHTPHRCCLPGSTLRKA